MSTTPPAVRIAKHVNKESARALFEQGYQLVLSHQRFNELLVTPATGLHTRDDGTWHDLLRAATYLPGGRTVFYFLPDSPLPESARLAQIIRMARELYEESSLLPDTEGRGPITDAAARTWDLARQRYTSLRHTSAAGS